MSKFSFQNYLTIAESLSTLLYPYAEVVIHDVSTETIVAIFNPYSKRKIGDPSLLEKDHDFSQGPNILGPYSKINWDGKPLKSITSIIRDEKNRVQGLMCINLDLSALNQFHQILGVFLEKGLLNTQPDSLFKDDWREKINIYINTYLQKNKKTINSLSSEEKCSLIVLLEKEGAFNGKNAANYMGDLLGISRASVYKYLKTSKK